MNDSPSRPTDNAFLGPLRGGSTEAAYAGALSFMRRRYSRDLVGIDVAVEALREYRRLRKGTVDELWRQADRLRMTRVMRPYWDAMSS